MHMMQFDREFMNNLKTLRATTLQYYHAKKFYVNVVIRVGY